MYYHQIHLNHYPIIIQSLSNGSKLLVHYWCLDSRWARISRRTFHRKHLLLFKGQSSLVVGGRETVPGEIPWQVRRESNLFLRYTICNQIHNLINEAACSTTHFNLLRFPPGQGGPSRHHWPRTLGREKRESAFLRRDFDR